MSPLPQALREFAEAHFGPLLNCTARGTAGAAYELHFEDGRRAFLKAHRERAKHLRELHAYSEWAPQISGASPALLATHDAPDALLLAAVASQACDPCALHAQAGTWLSRWHGLKFVDADPLPLQDAYLRRVQGWSHRACGVLESALIQAIVDQVMALVPEMASFCRVPCHRDFDPRNWLAGPEGIVVFDFEHARGDLWLQDLLRLASEVWPGAPELAAAFWRGYGRELSEVEVRLVEALVAFEAGSTLYWGLVHRDEAFIQRGRRWVQQLGLPI